MDSEMPMGESYESDNQTDAGTFVLIKPRVSEHNTKEGEFQLAEVAEGRNI